MIKASDGKIGTRELFALVILMIGMKATDTTPDLLLVDDNSAAWMFSLLNLVIVGIPFLVLLHLMKTYHADLTVLTKQLTGKYIGIGICALLFLFMLSTTITNMRSYGEIVTALFTPTLPGPVVLAAGISTTLFIAQRGLENIGRAAWFIIPFMAVMIITLFLLTWKFTNWQHIFPIGGPGMKVILTQTITHSSIFGDFILLSVLFSFIRSYRSFRVATLVGLVISCVSFSLLLLLFLAIFDAPEIFNIAYLFFQVTRLASFDGTITHIEGLYFSFWFIVSTIRFALYLYITSFLFAQTLCLKKFEPLIVIVTGFIFFAAQLPENIQQTSMIRVGTIKFGSAFLLGLPFVLWIISWLKRRRAA